MPFIAYLKDHVARHQAELGELLRIASISALSEHKDDCRRAADWLAARLSAAGLMGVEVIPTGGHPLVYGEWLQQPGAPTVLIYGHYDVQPVDPLSLWESAPFTPTIRAGRIYARGASDDKGQLLVHVQALEAWLKTVGRLPINVKVLFEGEEEIGSPHLGPFIRAQAARLAADALVISDTGMAAPGLPTICCGLRGIAALEAHVYGPNTDLHSGLYGGAVANPLHVLVAMLAALHDEQGRVAVPGFYDQVVALSEHEREELNRTPFDEDELARQLGVEALYGEAGFNALERTSIRPTLELNGVWGGFQGEGSKTVIPAEAHAKITCRLVPDQDPQRIATLVAEQLRRLCPPAARVEVVSGHGGRPWTCSPQTPALQAALQALATTFGRPAALARGGGSIPVVDTFASVLNVPIILMGFAPPDANAHAPNESMELEVWEKAREASGRLWQELAAIGQAKPGSGGNAP